MFTSIVIKDDKNELDFGKQFYAEVEVEVDYSFPSYDDWEFESELIINEYTVNYIVLNPVDSNKKLLQSFENNEEDVWENLEKEKQEKVYSWVGEKIKTKEIKDELVEAAIDEYVDYQERKAEGEY
jgi:hypothetical protein